MKVTAATAVVLGLLAILVPQSNARSVLVDQVTSALQGSFDALNAKRSDWLNNYSTMNNMTKTDSASMKELLLTSKLVMPLMWQMYATSVRKQKKFYDIVVNEEEQSLPFRAHAVPTNMGSNMYFEATLLLQQYRDFQVQILLNKVEIFFLNVHFNERRAVIGHSVHDETEEKAVLADDHFPEITLNKPFRINVQVVEDCIVASIWLSNLELTVPMPLPEKHIWCTREYTLFTRNTYYLNIHPIGGHLRQFLEEDHASHEEQEDNEQQNASNESQEDHEYEASDMKLVSAVVYNGLIFQ
ncbi:hypothetical protein O3P69_001928 [Scylla paramamosain]|uniref:Uncharacterized protein n=1 Tax=Scylla paramamosain TaxID=85552 RepID=A0AAW0V1G2_SCYPA